MNRDCDINRKDAGRAITLVLTLALLVGCSGGSPVNSGAGTAPDNAGVGCDGSCATAASVMTVSDVQQVIAQAVSEARARNMNATIAVVDRVGNVLGVYRMGNPALRSVTVTSTPEGVAPIRGGLEGIRLPVAAAPVNIDHAAAIAKAVTGAYLSSEGNAFSTRSASQIVQEHFNPGEPFQAGGPLFGVQFSQLACSDLSVRFNDVGPSVGPQRSPLGLAADPGGLPLYKDGTVVGGVGVIADDFYSLDKIIQDRDRDADEAIALAGTFGFGAPADRRADRLTVEGKQLRFSDVEYAQLLVDPAQAPAFNLIAVGVGQVVAVPGYSDGILRAGVAFGQPASGIRPDGDVTFPGRDAFILVDEANTPRYPPRAGMDADLLGNAALTQREVLALLQSAVDVANRARAQIRRPPGSPARVTISVVDTKGEILGVVRTRDAPVFGIDVSLQKARSSTFMSSASAAQFIANLPDAKYLQTTDLSVAVVRVVPLARYVIDLRTFLQRPSMLDDGAIAMSDRANGNLARPFFPDGIDGEVHGPLSKPAGEWSVFSTGLQLDLSINAMLQHVLFVAGVPGIPDVVPGCAGVALANDLSAVGQTINSRRLANGLQIFPGSVPIYRGSTLVGGIGVSGDGIEQDDLIAFLGLHEAGEILGGSIGNAPMEMRADRLPVRDSRLRYVQCPQAPFIDDTTDDVCTGK